MSGKENNGELREKIITFTIKAIEIAALAFLAGGASHLGAKAFDKPKLIEGNVLPLNRKTGS